MKKFLLFLSLSLAALMGMAQTQYKEKISVTLDGTPFPDAESTITVTKYEDGTCDFTLPNFMLVDGENAMPVGTINLKGVTMTEAEGYTQIGTTQSIVIAPGNMEGVAEEDWLGPMLGEVPIVLEGKLTDTELYATISISFMGMEIGVTVGEDIPETPKGEAKDYTEKIAVTLDGTPFPDATSTITVTKYEDGTCDFTLPNFMLVDGENAMPVGTINLKGVTMTEAEGYTQIGTTQSIVIAPGNMEGVAEEDWLGPMLGEVPIVLEGKLTDTELYATISISFMGMEIGVTVGEDPQTGIGEVAAAKNNDKAVYNLSGVRVANAWNNALPKGIYVVGGKKVIK